jgi:hypothetical protein
LTDFSLPEPSFDSWQDLVKTLATQEMLGWIYRGLPNYVYPPVSKLERTLESAGVPPGGEWRDAENRAIGFFKRRARQLLAATPDDGDLLGWLSLMQHYGAPTRLIDWTGSPFVACYFAYERPDPKKTDAALWMLNAALCRNRFGTQRSIVPDHIGATPRITQVDGVVVDKSYPGRDVTMTSIAEEETNLIRSVIEDEANWPLPLHTLRPDARMAAQQASFVCLGRLGCDPPVIPELLKGVRSIRAASDPPLTEDSPFWWDYPPGGLVKKIRLRYEWRDEALVTLERLNINGDTLFPGLDGVGRATEVFVSRTRPGGAYGIWEDLAL